MYFNVLNCCLIYSDIQFLEANLFSCLFQHAHKDTLPTKHILTPLFRAIVYHPCAHPSANSHSLSLCLQAVTHLYKPVQGPTDGLSVSIWASPLAWVCTAMPAGLELNQTHLVQPHWYRWCFTVPIRTAQHQNESGIQATALKIKNKPTHARTHTHTVSPITHKIQLYITQITAMSHDWISQTGERAVSSHNQK